MKLYRIYTENTNDPYLFGGIQQFVDSFTTFETTGHWNLMQEKNLVIEVFSDRPETIRDLAHWIKGYLKQEAVLVLELEAKGGLI